MKIVQLVSLRKPDAQRLEGDQGFQGQTAVMSKWYATCVVLRMEEEAEPKEFQERHVGGVDGICCQHLQGTDVSKNYRDTRNCKNSEVAKQNMDPLRHPTMYVASMDIKTAFDVPKCIAQLLLEQHMHGWLIAALLWEMAGHEGEAAFENVESKFLVPKCIRQGSVEAPRLWLEMALQMLWNVDKGWKAKHGCSHSQ